MSNAKNLKNITLIIKFWDSNGHGKLLFPDFLRMVLPTLNGKLRASICERENYEIKPGNKLDHNIEYCFGRLLEKYCK